MENHVKIFIFILLSSVGTLLILVYLLYLESNNSLTILPPIFSTFSTSPSTSASPKNTLEAHFEDPIQNSTYDLKILNASFLHNSMRNYYGDSAPSQLNILWRHKLGQGTTKIGTETKIWKGAGWTGQPLLVVENGKKYLIQGAYDHHLKKIDAATGKLIWQYKFDDVIKGTGSLWINTQADSLHNFCIILQGSRAGKSTYASRIDSYRAISYFTGQELWRLNSARTASYSRDVDASALLLGDTAYIGLENGIFVSFNPNPQLASVRNKLLQPHIYKDTDTLYLKEDIASHGGNLVTESSPVLLHNRIYIASGSGHIWGYNLSNQQIEWDYKVGSDIDGTPVVTQDDCLLVAIEKQHIKGSGGVLKIDPSYPPEKAVQWFFPTRNKGFSSWEGGVIGSVAVNYHYKKKGDPNIAVFTSIDGFMHVLDTDRLASPRLMASYDSISYFPQPKVLYKHYVGPSISTPLIVQNKIIAATYKGIYLFEFNDSMQIKLKEKIKIRCESTPLVDSGKLYIASRNGYLYCLGQADSTQNFKN